MGNGSSYKTSEQNIYIPKEKNIIILQKFNKASTKEFVHQMSRKSMLNTGIFIHNYTNITYTVSPIVQI